MSFENLFNTLSSISFYSLFLPLLVAVFNARYAPKYLVPYQILIVVAALTDFSNYVFVSAGINNYLVLRAYTFIEITLIIFFYWAFFRQYHNAVFLLIILPVYFMVAAIDYSINGPVNFDNYATAFEALTFALISLWSFYYMIKHMIFESITGAPFFWFNTAILLYFGGNLILFVFDNYLLRFQTSSHHALWAIHSVLNIIYNIVLATGFWKTRNQ